MWGLMRCCIGGEGGIRTHVQAINPQPDFESGPLRPLRYLSAQKKNRSEFEKIREAVGFGKKLFVRCDIRSQATGAEKFPQHRAAGRLQHAGNHIEAMVGKRKIRAGQA